MKFLPEIKDKRVLKIAFDMIEQFELDLSGLVVYTEAASGVYKYTPLICVLAGAKQVYALAKDARFCRADEAIQNIKITAETWGIPEKLNFSIDKDPLEIQVADIVMNAGNIRPIDAWTVSMMQTTAVIPLMWDTWEFRSYEFDMKACRDRGILVLGTNEESMNFRRYTGELFLHMLHSNGLVVNGCQMLFIGHPLVAKAVGKAIRANGGEFAWTSFNSEAAKEDVPGFIPVEDRAKIRQSLTDIAVLAIDDRTFSRPVVGEGGLFSTEEIINLNDTLYILNRSGIIDHFGLDKAGIVVVPEGRYENGYLGFTTAMLSSQPFVELTVAGLKVGEVMARARLQGMNIAESAKHAISTSYAMDFSGNLSWLGQEAK